MYNVLKTKSSPSEEQSLSRQNEQANKLIRQIESTIEHGEYARAKRFTLNDDGAYRRLSQPLRHVIRPRYYPATESSRGLCVRVVLLTSFLPSKRRDVVLCGLCPSTCSFFEFGEWCVVLTTASPRSVR